MNLKYRYEMLLAMDGTKENDFERKAMFYIFAGHEDLYKKIDYIYDFQQYHIIPECLEDKDRVFSYSELQLIKLAFSHYNGYPADIHEIFYKLDQAYFDLALNSIKLKYFR